MTERRCPYCYKAFSPSKCQPNQAVCSALECQRKRSADYRHKKVAADPNYREACRESAGEWRKQHPDYWKQYRTAHPACVERNRDLQKGRDRKQRLQSLANNTPASRLKPCPATIWLLGPELHELANNISAPTQVWVLEALTPSGRSAGHLANNTHLAP